MRLVHTGAVVQYDGLKHTDDEHDALSTLFRFFPEGFGLGLSGVYAVWLLVIVLLYPLCRWVAAVKGRRTDWWLSYL